VAFLQLLDTNLLHKQAFSHYSQLPDTTSLKATNYTDSELEPKLVDFFAYINHAQIVSFGNVQYRVVCNLNGMTHYRL